MVFDRLEEKFVAKWWGNLKEDLVAKELLKLAYYYNEALIVPERNLSTIITLIEPGGEMPYTGDLYYQDIQSSGLQYGYYTHNEKKDLLMQYNAWLRDDYHKIPDQSILEEHITFIKEVKRGRPKYHASEGNHDDQVIACALAIEGHEWWDREIFEGENKPNITRIHSNKGSSRKSLKTGSLGKNNSRSGVKSTESYTKLGKS